MKSEHLRRMPLLAATLLVSCTFTVDLRAADFPGGFVEQPSTAAARPPYSRSQWLSIVPSRGKFTFPPPYNTTAIRLTSESDCNNADCVNHAGYAYWNNINNHVGRDTMLIFVGLDRNYGGAGPSLLQYNKVTDQVQNLGTLFDSTDPLSWSTGEGWYFSQTMPNALYVTSNARLLRRDVIARTTTTVFDLTTQLGNGYYLWQAHSSADDRVHSATVRRNDTYEMLGCVAYSENDNRYRYFPAKGVFDECQVDKSGKWLLIKEDVDGRDGEDNRIINLETLQERILLDADGAAGHSDMGHGYMIAADNFATTANAQKLWKFDAPTLSGTTVYHNADWRIAAPSHVSHGNALAGIAPEQQYACGSSVNRSSSAEANEIICFGLDGSDKALVVAPVMTDLDASGGRSEYARSPKGNLDPTGRYFIWTSNMGGPRLDYFLVKVPAHLLGSAVATTAPAVATVTADTTAPVLGAIRVSNVTTSSAVISWSTDEKAEDMVQYGASTAYGSSTTINTTAVTTHSRTLENLKPGTTYHFRVLARDAAGNVATSADMTFATTAAAQSTLPVLWSNLANAVAYGSTLVKSGGCDGCADSVGSSVQAIRSGDGYLEFTVGDSWKMVYAGLSVGQPVTTANQIDFALRLQSGYAEVREDGNYRSETAIRNGDILRIGIVGGRVVYSRNGTVFHTSAAAPGYPLHVHATLFSASSSINAVNLMGVLQ